MKLKYYMRTLGIGIIVTALLMGFATTPKGKDEEPSAEAISQEGAVLTDVATGESQAESESDTDAEASTEASLEEVPEVQEVPSREEISEEAESEETIEETVEESTEEVIEETVEETIAETEEAVSEAETEESSSEVIESNGEIVTFSIIRGDSSDRVARKLQDLGLIEDARAFDQYLCAKGYDKRISVGTYEIPKGSSESEIANIIAGK